MLSTSNIDFHQKGNYCSKVNFCCQHISKLKFFGFFCKASNNMKQYSQFKKTWSDSLLSSPHVQKMKLLYLKRCLLKK